MKFRGCDSIVNVDITVSYYVSADIYCIIAVFLLLARYVPNVAKEELKSVRSNIDDRPTTDDQPTDDRPQGLFTHFGKISNGHNSATRQPIPFMFGSRVGF